MLSPFRVAELSTNGMLKGIWLFGKYGLYQLIRAEDFVPPEILLYETANGGEGFSGMWCKLREIRRPLFITPRKARISARYWQE